jgi:hypothetical protein
MILDVIGDLLANGCQVEEFLFDEPSRCRAFRFLARVEHKPKPPHAGEELAPEAMSAIERITDKFWMI